MMKPTTPHLTVGYSGHLADGRYVHGAVIISLDSLEALGRGQYDLNRLLLDVDRHLEDAELALGREVCDVCEGTGNVWEDDEEARKGPCPACHGEGRR